MSSEVEDGELPAGVSVVLLEWRDQLQQQVAPMYRSIGSSIIANQL